MRQGIKKRIFFFLFFLFLSSDSLKLTVSAATFFGDPPKGLVELSEYHYPVFLFVPPNYQPDREYPLLIVISGEGELPDKNIEFWQGVAKRRSMILLAPTNFWPNDLPYDMDKWLFQIKKDLTEKYRIAAGRIYLVGMNAGAHYAGYLGVSYPEEFSAVAMLGGSWAGRYEKIMFLQETPRKQIPFLVVLKPDGEELISETESKAYQFEKKGYPVFFVKLKPGEDFAQDEFKKRVLTWLEEKGTDWKAAAAAGGGGWRQKLSTWRENFFKL